MGNGKLVPVKEQVNDVRGILERMEPQFKMALPRLLKSDRFIRIALTEIQRTPALLKCNRVSLLGALMECAQLGLEPGLLGQAYLVPYKDRVTLIPGYKGLIALARRSGQVRSISAHVVYEADEFDFGLGDDPYIKHRPSSKPEPGEVIAAYAVANLAPDGKHQEVMWRHQIDAIRKRSAASKSGPWVTDFEEMARKTVIRRLCKFLPLSVELQAAVALDEAAEAGIVQPLPHVDYVPETGEAVERPTLDAVAEEIAPSAEAEEVEETADEAEVAP